MAEETVLPIPNLALSQNLFVLSTPSLGHLHDKARADLLAGIRADEMGPWYKNIPASNTALGLADDGALRGELEARNTQELGKLDERLEEARKCGDETEICKALKARANYLTRIDDKVDEGARGL
ncbi:hypothetical protein FA15DRAFT_661753 [Coprinopsis marcescibilis]|uniref:Uncharacterized protein n=1 Tax=Coprinopsis marcescibilis TaxID=230819 RepID=A0A5C3KAU8_COPMA|nr:hypothetical protein FA15DRAFT_661753 [Coprinopsis marcescibilis]